MSTVSQNQGNFRKDSRRKFIQKSGLFVAGAGVVGLSGMAISCNDQKKTETAENEKEEEEKGEEQVSPNEDLMREHGLLQRMLLIYDTALLRFNSKEEFDPSYINQTATIVHDFIEEYHEKLEEDFVFPRLEKANRLTELTSTLRQQHINGRAVTGKILNLTKNGRTLKGSDQQELIKLMQSFNIMYRPHEAREDTILFPAFKEVVSRHEYDALGEDFEKKEREKFGEGGFDGMVDKVAEIEKQIGIYDLNQFTPHVEQHSSK
ncbi:MAG: hemerythrin domain-containing protein [Salegentibacter sp.]